MGIAVPANQSSSFVLRGEKLFSFFFKLQSNCYVSFYTAWSCVFLDKCVCECCKDVFSYAVENEKLMVV